MVLGQWQCWGPQVSLGSGVASLPFGATLTLCQVESGTQAGPAFWVLVVGPRGGSTCVVWGALSQKLTPSAFFPFRSLGKSLEASCLGSLLWRLGRTSLSRPS